MAISTAQKLAVYNGALLRLGSRKLSSLSEARKPRRVLDEVWGANNDAVLYALSKGDWNFAIRAAEVSYDTGVTTTFGFNRAFSRPTDFVRMSSLSADPKFATPLTNRSYTEEAGYWYSDYDTLYVKYVSNDTDYGLDASAWTKAFTNFLQCYMAFEACQEITGSSALKRELKDDMADYLKDAKSVDTMSEGVKFPPRGSWTRARGRSIDDRVTEIPSP